MPAEVEAGEVAVVAGAALGKLLVLCLRPVRRQRVLVGRCSCLSRPRVPGHGHEAHVNVEGGWVGIHELINDVRMRDAVVQQQVDLRRLHVVAVRAVKRRYLR